MENKQIEEMAHILCGLPNGCFGCMFDQAYCNERNFANEIYNLGYRKASEVVKEIEKYILEGVTTIRSKNSDCMYGAIFAIEEVVLPILKAFKKKYKEDTDSGK